MLMLVFLISIAVLLFCIIKAKLNAFVALLVCAYGTGLLALATYAPGAAYFKQVQFGVYVRMALILTLLGLDK